QRLRLHFPNQLSLESPEARKAIKDYRDWLTDNGGYIEDSLDKICKALNDPAKILHFGDVPGVVRVHFDSNGRMDRILGPEEKDLNGTKVANNLSCRCSVEFEGGQYTFTSRIQAQQVDWWNWLNIGATNLGAPSELKIGPFDPDQRVLIRNGEGQIDVVAARDVEWFMRVQKASHWGGKVSSGVMDVSMLVSGLASGGASLVANRAGGLAGRAALRAAVPAMARATLGGAGILNNAAVNSSESGRRFNQARGLAMLLDVSANTVKGIRGFFGAAGKSAAEIQLAAATARGFQECGQPLYLLTKPLDFAANSKLHSGIMIGANLYYGPVLITDIVAQARKMGQKKVEFAYDKALDHLNGGRRLESLADGTVTALGEFNRAQQLATLDGYLCLLANSSGAKTSEINTIGQRCSELMNPEYPDNIQEPILRDAERRIQIETYKVQLATTMRSGSDANLRASAAAALIFLSTDEDGALPKDKVLTRFGKELITTDMAVACLEDKLGNGSNAAKFVASDILGRLRHVTPFTQATVLSELMGNSAASPAERIAAMTQLAQLCNGIRLIESNVVPGLSPQERDVFNGHSYGATSTDILKAFRRLASNPAVDKNIRGLAVGIIFELGVSNEADLLAQTIGQRALDCAEASALRSNSTTYLDQVVQDLVFSATEDQTANPVTRIAALVALEELKDSSPFRGEAGRKRL
ncbi:MAG: hypothetical protein K2Z81_17435, partial [Cyanobacteria bacterium]|nr:hypothetical protein [Cyanobacteriota bacterium]